MLVRKQRRDLLEHWPQFTAVLVMAVLSVAVYLGLEGGWRGMERELDRFADEQSMADAWIQGVALTNADAQAVRDLDGVEAATLATTMGVSHVRPGTDGTLQLVVAEDDDVNTPLVVDGAALSPGSADEVWLDQRYAEANGLSVGDPVLLATGGTEAEVQVAGLVLAPDRITWTGAGRVAPDPSQVGYALAGPDLLPRLGHHGGGTQIWVRGSTGTGDLRDRVPGILGERYLGTADRTELPTVATAYDRVDQIRSLSVLFSSLFVMVALLCMVTSIRRLTDIQRSEVATLKALGHRRSTIGWFFAGFALLTVGTGAVLGLLLAPLLARFVLSTQRPSFALPRWSPAWSWWSLALPVGLVVVCLLATWLATRQARRTMPAEGMRPAQGGGRRIPLERWRWFWGRLDEGVRWAVRDAAGSPVRVLVGVVATAGCMMLLAAGFGMPETLNRQLDESYGQQYRYQSMVVLAAPAGPDHRADVEEHAGPGQWVMAVPAETAGESPVPVEVTVLGPGEEFVLLGPDGQAVGVGDGAVLTVPEAERLGRSVGDRLELSVPGDQSLALEVAGTTTISEPQGAVVSQGAWEAGGQIFAPTLYLTSQEPDDQVHRLDAVSSVLTLAEQRANAEELIGSLSGVFALLRIFAVVLAVVVLYNLGALSFTERVRDYATLRVLGSRPGELRTLAALENVGTALVGWAVGLPAGAWFLSRYVGLFSTDQAVYTPYLSPRGWVLISVVTLAFGAAATLLLTRRLRRVDMASALKGVE